MGGGTCLGEVGGGLEDDEGVGGDDRCRDGGEVVRVVGGRGGARGAVHGGVVGVGTAGHPAVQAEEVAEPGCKSPRVFGDEEGDVVALAQGVGVAAGGGTDPAAPRAPVEGRFTGLSVSGCVGVC